MHGLHHGHVAGHLQHRGEVDQAVALAVVVEDRPAPDGELAAVIHLAGWVNGVLLQSNGQVDRLKSGSRLVEVLHGPFPEQPRLEVPEAVWVVGGGGGQGHHLPIAHVHHQGHAALGLPLLHLLGEGQLGHLLQAGIQRELQAQIVAVEHAGLEAIGQGRAIGSPAQGAARFMAFEIAVAALLQARLGCSLQVEEAHDIGEQASLRIHPLGIGLQIQTADAQIAYALGRFWIQIRGHLHA